MKKSEIQVSLPSTESSQCIDGVYYSSEEKDASHSTRSSQKPRELLNPIFLKATWYKNGQKNFRNNYISMWRWGPSEV